MSFAAVAAWSRALAGSARFALWLERTHWRATETRCRAEWMRTACRELLDHLHVQRQVLGPAPTGGLVAANHLSYLDVLLLGAEAPGTFVCKSEVAHWPILGPLLRRAGTLFVDRSSRRDAARLVDLLARRPADELVVLFPEGTTSAGHEVLPFHSPLLAPWADPRRLVQPAALGYRTAAGDAATRVSYWGDATFGPHLFHLLGRRDLEARLVFGPAFTPPDDRKRLAERLEASVRLLHQERIEPWQNCRAGTAPAFAEANPPLPAT